MKQKHFFLYITDLKSAFLFSTGFDNFFYNTVLYESDMTSYPASSTAFLSSILLNSRSYEIIASLSFKDTFAEAPATLLDYILSG